MKRVAAVLALVASTACNDTSKLDAGAASRPDESTATPPASIEDGGLAAVDAAPDADAGVDVAWMFDKAITLLENTANLVVANMNDCDAMGQRLEAYRQEHADFTTQMWAVYERGLGERRKAIQAQYRTRFKAAWAKIRPGMMKCKDTPSVNAVIHKIWRDEPEPKLAPDE